MPVLKFEPTTAVFLLMKSVHALERSATEIGTKTKTKLHGMSPRANYTHRATTACYRS
jgi:hypothetical protein